MWPGLLPGFTFVCPVSAFSVCLLCTPESLGLSSHSPGPCGAGSPAGQVGNEWASMVLYSNRSYEERWMGRQGAAWSLAGVLRVGLSEEEMHGVRWQPVDLKEENGRWRNRVGEREAE